MGTRIPTISTALQAAAIYSLFSALFLYIVFGSAGVFTDDGFYHYRVATLIRTHGLWFDIDSLPYTILGEHGVDHHWLWHLLIVPFTGFFANEFIGLKVTIALLGAIVPLAIFIFTKNFSVPAPWLVTALAMFAIADLPGRYLMLCAQNIAIVLLLSHIIFFVRRNYLACGIMAWLFMLSYHGAVILLPVALIACLLSFFYYQMFDFKILLATVAGLLLGLIINPWFPETFHYIYFHFAHKMLTHTSMAVGQEFAHEVQHCQQCQADAKAPGDQFLLHRQQWLVFLLHLLQLFANLRFFSHRSWFQ